jgi:hypothetical protein
MSPQELRLRVVRLAFGGHQGRYAEFLAALRAVIPPDVECSRRHGSQSGSGGRRAITFRCWSNCIRQDYRIVQD